MATAALRVHLREHFAALLATAAVLLIVGHWPRFGIGDVVLIAMIVGSAGLHLVMRARSHDTGNASRSRTTYSGSPAAEPFPNKGEDHDITS